MEITSYYIIELTEEVKSIINSKIYNKGKRLMVWEDDFGNYWICNTADIIPKEKADKVYIFTGKEIYNLREA